MSDSLQDVLISELPRIDQFSYDDLLVLDVKKAGREIFETHAITWGHLSGTYPPGSDGGGNGGGDGDGDGNDINNDINLRGRVRFLDGTELRPSITFIRDDNTGFYRPKNNTIGVTTGGTRCMVWSDQRVGINTDTPDEMLHLQEGNLKITLGDNDNNLYLGSSNRSRGGDPSVQSIGTNPLTFHINKQEWFRIDQYGAFGLRFGQLILDYGKDLNFLVSQGPEKPVRWADKSEIIDVNQLIEDLQNTIGKGKLQVHSEGEYRLNGLTIGTDDTDYVDLSSGIDVQTLKGGDLQPIIDPVTKLPVQTLDNIEDPNANSFYEGGWYLKLDETVVRTDGYQVISNMKAFDGELKISDGGNLKVYRSGNIDFHKIETLPIRR